MAQTKRLIGMVTSRGQGGGPQRDTVCATSLAGNRQVERPWSHGASRLKRAVLSWKRSDVCPGREVAATQEIA